MVAALGDFELLFTALTRHPVDQPIFHCYPSGPPALQIAAQRLRLADAGKGLALAVADQSIQPFQKALVVRLPVEIVFPGPLWKTILTYRSGRGFRVPGVQATDRLQEARGVRSTG